MAMQIPMIVPKYSALGEWAKGGVHYTELSDIPYYHVRGLNTRGAIPTAASVIHALELLYTNTQYRTLTAKQGYRIATQPQFQWKVIAQQMHTVLTEAPIHSIGIQDDSKK